MFPGRRLLLNVSSLSVANAGQYLVALATFPYLVRVLGPETFGTVAFAQAFVAYFSLIVNFGFDLSGSRDVAYFRDHTESVSETFWVIIAAKAVVLALVTVVFVPVVAMVPFFKREALLYALSFGVILGNVLYPTWFFTGIEKLWYVGSVNFLIKMGYAVGIFIIVRSPSDYLYVPLLLCTTEILGGALGFLLALKHINLVKTPHIFSRIPSQLKRSFPFFLNQGMTRIYMASNTFLLGLLTNTQMVGYFSAGERVITALLSLTLMPISGAVYPRVANTLRRSPGEVRSVLRKVFIPSMAFFSSVSFALFLTSSLAVRVVLGAQYSHTVPVLRILAFVPLVSFMGNFFGLQVLTNLGHVRSYTVILLISLVVNLALNFFLDRRLGPSGAAISWLVTEICIAVGSFIVSRGITKEWKAERMNIENPVLSVKDQ